MSTLISIGLKYVLPVLFVLVALFGVYEYGHAKGTTEGYAAGHKVAWDTQQLTINDLVTKIDNNTKALNDKVTDLEKKAAQDAADLFQAKVDAAAARGQVVVQYEKANPVVSASCGWDEPTVTAINQILSAGANTK